MLFCNIPGLEIKIKLILTVLHVSGEVKAFFFAPKCSEPFLEGILGYSITHVFYIPPNCFITMGNVDVTYYVKREKTAQEDR